MAIHTRPWTSDSKHQHATPGEYQLQVEPFPSFAPSTQLLICPLYGKEEDKLTVIFNERISDKQSINERKLLKALEFRVVDGVAQDPL